MNVGDKVKSNMSKFRAVARARWGLGGKDLAVGCTQKDVSRLATAQRSALLVVTRAYRTISGPALLVIAGVRHIQR